MASHYFEGFDHTGVQRLYLVYASAGTSFAGGFKVPGHYIDAYPMDTAGALALLNTGFGSISYITQGFSSTALIPAGNVWFYADLAITNSTIVPWNVHCEFALMLTQSGPGYNRQIAFAINESLQLEIFLGGSSAFDGILLYQSPANFFPGQTVDSHGNATTVSTFISLAVQFDVTHGIMRVYKDQTLVATVHHSLYDTATACDTLIVANWEHLGNTGLIFDNVTLSTDAISRPRVTTQFIKIDPHADVLLGSYVNVWTYGGTQTSVGQALTDQAISPWGSNNYPDILGESCIRGSGLVLFQMARCIPIGPVKAVVLRVTLKKRTTGNADIRGAVRKGSTSYAVTQVVTNIYQTLSFYWERDPFTGLAWDEQDFVGGTFAWGLAASDDVEVSQIVLTRLHDFVNQPGPKYYANK